MLEPGGRIRRQDRAVDLLPLSVQDLRYEAEGRRLIDGVSCTLTQGPLTIILGPNGAGKSLLLRLAHGLIQPTSGGISWGGLKPGASRPWQAMVFQRPVLLRRSAAANIAYALALQGYSRSQRKQLAAAALSQAGLSHLAERPARVLSGGEQQRLAIARAWALRPKVMLLDEPTSHLDPAATAAIEALIGSVHRAGAKIIMTTHDLGQARRLAGEVLFLHQGRLLEHTPAGQFFQGPSSAEAGAFIKGKLLC